MKRAVLFLMLSLVEVSIFSQIREIIFNQIQKSDGVLYNVFNLIQDHNGFVWFRTAGNQGIQRYDGYEFVNFLDSSGYFNSISEDSKGLLWLGTSSGITLFNPESERSVHFLPFPESANGRLSLNNITKIIEDRDGNIWCATNDGILKLIPGTGPNNSRFIENIFEKNIKSTFNIHDFRFHQHDTAKGINQVSEIYQDSHGRIWAGGTGCLYIYMPETNSFMRIDDVTGNRSKLGDAIITGITEENPDVLWIGTGNGLCRISNIEKALSKSGIDKTFLEFNHYLGMKLITGLLMDKQHKLWIGTYMNGLVEMQYDRSRKPQFKEVYTELYKPEGEGIRTVFSLMKDRTGLIWAGHRYGGIRKFNPAGNIFASYDELIRLNFTNYDLYPITKDTGDNLWVGTYGDGLQKISKAGKVTGYHIFDEAVPDRSGNGVISLLKITDDNFWIGAVNGIWQFNTRTGKSRKLFTRTRYGELNDHVYDIQRIGNYVLFSLWEEGVFIYNLSTEELTQYKFIPKDLPGLRSDINYSICPMRNGEVYIGGSRGLSMLSFNKTTGEISFLPVPFSKVAFAGLGSFNKVHEDRDGVLWCGTDKGLLKLNITTGEAQLWTEKDGLSSNVVHSIEEDDKGNLWLGTTKGLSWLNPETGKIKIFNKNNGLPIEIHAHHSSFRDREGFLYFGGIGGFYRFHPDSIQTSDLIPPIVITDFRLFNKSVKVDIAGRAVLKTNIAYTRKIILAHNQHDLSFVFAALDYTNPDQNRYAYRLDRYQDEWTETDANNRIATYTNLNPGKYVFRLKGSNSDGIWNEEGISLSILIKPPFWKTTLAYIAYAILFLVLIRSYIYWRTRRLSREKIVLEKQVKERTEELQTSLENLQKTQKQLIESEKMAALGGLVAGVAHEVNTPVGIGITAITTLMDDIQNMAGLFKRNEISRTDFKEFLQTSYDAGELIRKNLERTASLIQSFKLISVDQASEQQRVFRLRPYLDDIIRSLFPKYKEKRIFFHILCDDDIELNSFPGTYAQIFTNLLLNSFVHGFHQRETGSIDIRVTTNNETLKIEYRDDGNGISSKDLPRIFEPFYTSDQRRGTGLGLNIVYNLVSQKLNGNITCNSEEGKGVLFEVELPFSKVT